MREFCIASFRSRTQVMSFNRLLTGAGIKSEIISTPREVRIGCGLSVSFDCTSYATVKSVYAQNKFQGFAGFYKVINDGYTVNVLPLSRDYTV